MDFSKIDVLKDRLKTLRPLNKAELTRLRASFMIENTYHSNAIEGNTLTLRETALILQEGITIGEKPPPLRRREYVTEKNMNRLLSSINQAKAGDVVVRTLAELEAMETV